MITLKCTVLWNLSSYLQNVVTDTFKPLENICNITRKQLHATCGHFRTLKNKNNKKIQNHFSKRKMNKGILLVVICTTVSAKS